MSGVQMSLRVAPATAAQAAQKTEQRVLHREGCSWGGGAPHPSVVGARRSAELDMADCSPSFPLARLFFLHFELYSSSSFFLSSYHLEC